MTSHHNREQLERRWIDGTQWAAVTSVSGCSRLATDQGGF